MVFQATQVLLLERGWDGGHELVLSDLYQILEIIYDGKRGLNFSIIQVNLFHSISPQMHMYCFPHLRYIMQSHGEVDHILKRPMFPGTAYKMNAIQELKRQAKDNTKIVMDLERSVARLSCCV